MNFVAVIFSMFVLILAGALIGAVFIYLGWNHGVVFAVDGVKHLDLVNCLFLSLFISTVGAAFQTKLESN